MTKIAESESGSISQRHGSADPDPDPDPHQNVMDPQHCMPELTLSPPVRDYEFGYRGNILQVLEA
jgi:hypothetical protein